MNLRHAAALALVGLLIAIMIYALRPRYYLIVAFPEKPVVQLGPFATQASCDRARQQMSEILVSSEPLEKKGREEITGVMDCVSSR
jgi:hypothetical protein